MCYVTKNRNMDLEKNYSEYFIIKFLSEMNSLYYAICRKKYKMSHVIIEAMFNNKKYKKFLNTFFPNYYLYAYVLLNSYQLNCRGFKSQGR